MTEPQTAAGKALLEILNIQALHVGLPPELTQDFPDRIHAVEREAQAAGAARLREVTEALRQLSRRHEWQPDLGPCVCVEHQAARALLAGVAPEPPAVLRNLTSSDQREALAQALSPHEHLGVTPEDLATFQELWPIDPGVAPEPPADLATKAAIVFFETDTTRDHGRHAARKMYSAGCTRCADEARVFAKLRAPAETDRP